MSTTKERAAAAEAVPAGQKRLQTPMDDERFGSSRWLVSALDKIFPDHWSFMVGEIAMDSLIILIVTGIYLALFYVPSSTTWCTRRPPGTCTPRWSASTCPRPTSR